MGYKTQRDRRFASGRRFALAAACLAGLGFVSGSAFADSECSLIFYDLNLTKQGKAGADDAAVCLALRDAVSADANAGTVSHQLIRAGGRVSCVVTTHPGDLSRDALDRFRFNLGRIVRDAAGPSYKSWSSNCR